jgi:predicted sulfurtransferase
VKHSPGFLKLVDDAKSRVREVSVEETRRKLETGKAKVIDVREESEWAAGHARGAEHIGKGVIERDIEARVPDKNAEIILYCGGGFRVVGRQSSKNGVQERGVDGRGLARLAGGRRAD